MTPPSTYTSPLMLGVAGFRSLLTTDPVLLLRVPDIYARAGVDSLDANTPMPYVRIEHVFGGFLNTSNVPMFDMQFIIETISRDQVEASEVDAIVHGALLHKNPTFPGNWCPYAPITEVWPHSDVYEVQGHTYHAFGGTFRIRGYLIPTE